MRASRQAAGRGDGNRTQSQFLASTSECAQTAPARHLLLSESTRRSMLGQTPAGVADFASYSTDQLSKAPHRQPVSVLEQTAPEDALQTNPLQHGFAAEQVWRTPAQTVGAMSSR
jgi:hypothetical protein